MKDMGATVLFLYGSTARDEAQATSDLDLFIDYEPGSRFFLLDLVGMKQFLEEELAMDVDITTPEQPPPHAAGWYRAIRRAYFLMTTRKVAPILAEILNTIAGIEIHTAGKSWGGRFPTSKIFARQ